VSAIVCTLYFVAKRFLSPSRFLLLASALGKAISIVVQSTEHELRFLLLRRLLAGTVFKDVVWGRGLIGGFTSAIPVAAQGDEFHIFVDPGYVVCRLFALGPKCDPTDLEICSRGCAANLRT